MHLSVVIPVYRGTTALEQLVRELVAELSNLEYEVLLIFDGGKEASFNVSKALAQDFDNIYYIELSRNFGQHNATICGLSQSKGDFIVTMDEDMQHSPKDVIRLVEACKNTCSDVVYGKYIEKNHGFFRNVTSTLLKGLLRIGIPELHPDYTSFRCMTSEVAHAIPEMRNAYTFLDGYVTWITRKVTSIDVQHSESEERLSSYSIAKLINHTINIFITFSALPIRALTFLGLGTFLVSSLYSIYILFQYFTEVEFSPGFPTVASFLGFGFGFVLLGLAVIGEYVQRVNQKATNRPNYVIRKNVS